MHAKDEEPPDEQLLLYENVKPSLTRLSRALRGAGYAVTEAREPEEVLALAAAEKFSAAVLYMTLGETGPAEWLGKLRRLDPGLKIILMVDRTPVDAVFKTLCSVARLGVSDCLLRPADPNRLIAAVWLALQTRPAAAPAALRSV